MFSNVHPLHKAQGQERHSSASQSISLDKKHFKLLHFIGLTVIQILLQ